MTITGRNSSYLKHFMVGRIEELRTLTGTNTDAKDSIVLTFVYAF